tara:strand:+ start:1027 stop:1317 length:291 start_codon:yes stop_codon:yes gene_type:complete
MEQKKLNFFTIRDTHHAIGIIEEFIDIPSGVDEYDANIHAWQYLIDTGTVWHLQGWYGRTARDLIHEGICKAKKTIGENTQSTKASNTPKKPKKTL